MCGSRAQHFTEKQDSGRQGEQPDEDDVGNLGLFHHSSGGRKPWSVTLAINSVQLEMEIDTGSARTIVSWKTFDRLLGGQKLEPTIMVLGNLCRWNTATLRNMPGGSGLWRQ